MDGSGVTLFVHPTYTSTESHVRGLVTGKLARKKQRLRKQPGAFYPLADLQHLVVHVQETNRVRFLDDRHDDPFEYDVVEHNGELVVKGHINKIEKTPKCNRELAYDEEGLMEDGEDERCGQASDDQADEQESADMDNNDDEEDLNEELVESKGRKRQRSEGSGEIRKRTSRVPKVVVALPKVDDKELLTLCGMKVDVPLIQDVQKLSACQIHYHQFHRGMQDGENREDYALSVIGALNYDNICFSTIPNSMDYGVDYSDGVALRVYRSLIPQQLTEHFFRVANSYRGTMRNCGTRRTSTLHLGAKEYNPNLIQQAAGMPKRVWRQDVQVHKEQTKALLPELLFANSVLEQVSKESYDLKMGIEPKFRLAGTGFTRVAVNSGSCRIHRDFGTGLDVLIYAGKWAVGGDLVIPQLGVIINLKAGDVVVMDSGLFHRVTDFEGTRLVAVFFSKTHNLVSDAGNVLTVPNELLWLSNEMFKDV